MACKRQPTEQVKSEAYDAADSPDVKLGAEVAAEDLLWRTQSKRCEAAERRLLTCNLRCEDSRLSIDTKPKRLKR